MTNATQLVAVHHLTAYLEGVSDLSFLDKAFFSALGEMLTISTRERFDQEISPSGDKWAALSPQYRKRKRKQDYGDKILQYEGELRNTLRYQATDTELRFGSDRAYAAIHQFGGAFKAFGKYAATMPARPYLGISTADEADIQDAITDAYEAWLTTQS